MKHKLPLFPAALSLATTGFLLSCQGKDPAEQQMDPRFGRECFYAHQSTLPPGSQYEGAEAAGDKIRVKIMNGVDLRTIECRLGPNGELDLGGTGSE